MRELTKPEIIFQVVKALHTNYDKWDGYFKVIYLPDSIAGLGNRGTVESVNARCSRNTGFTIQDPFVLFEGNNAITLWELSLSELKEIIAYIEKRFCIALQKGKMDLRDQQTEFVRNLKRPKYSGALTLDDIPALDKWDKPRDYVKQMAVGSNRNLEGKSGDELIKGILHEIDENPFAYMWLVDLRSIPTLEEYETGTPTENSRMRDAFNASKVAVVDETERYKLVSYWDHKGNTHENAGFYDANTGEAFVLRDESLGHPDVIAGVRMYDYVLAPSLTTPPQSCTDRVFRITTLLWDHDYVWNIDKVVTTVRTLDIVRRNVGDKFWVLMGNQKTLLVATDAGRRYLVSSDEEVQVGGCEVMHVIGMVPRN